MDAATGGVIGLVDCAILNRTEGKVTDHKQRGADDKESRRWLHGTEVAGDCLADAEMITMVGDRESDIYDLFARRPVNTHLLCRSAQDRTLATGGLLSEYCATLPEQARDSIAVPAKGKQAGPPGHGGAGAADRYLVPHALDHRTSAPFVEIARPSH